MSTRVFLRFPSISSSRKPAIVSSSPTPMTILSTSANPIITLLSLLSPRHPSRALFDSSGNPIIFIFRDNLGSWKAFKEDGRSEELLFRAEQTLNTSTKIEFNIVLVREDGEDIALTMRGCPYWRSCTIYQDKTIVAQTNLMHKFGLKKIFSRRNKSIVTFFPGFSNYNLIAALVLIFLDGR
uniref:Uncharacterized protein n=1 Tax=Opuntia streptacantha TaxID=393608 RepID=A0A7C9FE30_OPUST